MAILASGCSQKVAPVITQKTLPTTITDWTQPGFGNPDNPYDTVGLRHNQGLNYIASLLPTVVPGNESYPGTDTLAVYFIDSIEGFPADSGLWFGRFALTHEDSLFTALNSGNVFSDTAINYFSEIDSIYSSNDSLGARIDSIESIETSATSTLSGSNLIFVQCCGAIAQYSLSYWNSNDTIQWAGKKNPQRAIVNRALGKGNMRILGDWASDDARGAAVTAYAYGGWWFVGGGISVGVGVGLTLLGGLMASGGDF